jgi:hypothetical protein
MAARKKTRSKVGPKTKRKRKPVATLRARKGSRLKTAAKVIWVAILVSPIPPVP